MPDSIKKTVVVTGDVLVDHNLLPHGNWKASYTSPLSTSIEVKAHGGAWFLAEWIKEIAEAAFKTPGSKPDVIAPSKSDFNSVSVANAYTKWAKYKPLKTSKDKEDRVYRVEEFLGCQRPDSIDEELYLPAIKTTASVVVIDDLRQGFADNDSIWPEFLQKAQSWWETVQNKSSTPSKLPEGIAAMLPQHIVFKMGGPPDNSKLWKLLLHVRELREILTVVIYVDYLRQRGSELSKGLSWDRAIEEIQEEFRIGPSSYDLGWCKRVCVVLEGGCGAALLSHDWLRMGQRPEKPPEEPDPKYAAPTLQRFLYLPGEVEGVHTATFDGTLYGASSLVTASLVMHLLDETNFPVFISLGRGLAALRHNQLQGMKLNGRDFDPDWDGIVARVAWEKGRVKELKKDPAFEFSTNWPVRDDVSPISQNGRADGKIRPGSAEMIVKSDDGSQEPKYHSDLLGDFAGPTFEYMYAVASRIVRDGYEEVLAAVPKAKYGDYFTVDRQEIERINAVRSLVLTYLSNPADKRPLSIAVFGQPGSGKSFAIKQLFKSLEGSKSPFTFNLSEFPDDPTEALKQLQSALHQVRDQSISGGIPLVFWDEFDAGNLRWLKQFLAPMQDSEFRAGSIVHSLGRAVFVFAGGTCHSYEQFRMKVRADSDAAAKKGPDFISRLRGYIDIKGPDDQTLGSDDGTESANDIPDVAHVIRRAVLLRSLLQRNYPKLIDQGNKKAAVSESVLRGFLRVSRYAHGVRSMESILSMSDIADATHFGSSQLPPSEQLQMHVNAKEFLDQVRSGELTADVIEPIAEATHTAYKQLRAAMGDNNVDDYWKLNDDWREPNRAVARVATAKLAEAGYEVRRRQFNSGSIADAIARLEEPNARVENRRLIDVLCVFEHDRWLREKLLQGFEFGELRDPPLNDPLQMERWLQDEARMKEVRRNWNIQPYDDLHEKFRELDAIAPKEIVTKLWEFGYEIVMRT